MCGHLVGGEGGAVAAMFLLAGLVRVLPVLPLLARRRVPAIVRSVVTISGGVLVPCTNTASASKSSIRRFVITEKAPTRAFS